MPQPSDDAAWMTKATCSGADEDLWFPGAGKSPVHAQRICHTCPVEQTCLEYALERNIEHGVWGGTSERQRRRIRAEYVQIKERVAS